MIICTDKSLLFIIEDIKVYMKKYIAILVDRGIYDKTEDDYVNNNQGLELLLKLTDLKFQIKELLWQQMNNMATNQINDVQFNAYSQVTGNQCGIITNSAVGKDTVQR